MRVFAMQVPWQTVVAIIRKAFLRSDDVQCKSR